MKQSYFDKNDDLSRCSASQHARVWSVWYLIAARRPQELGPHPRWWEFAVCWLFHHATHGILWLAELRRKLRRILG